jgi:hypothetical protein
VQLHESTRSAAGWSLELDDPQAVIGEVAMAIEVGEEIEDLSGGGGNRGTRDD